MDQNGIFGDRKVFPDLTGPIPGNVPQTAKFWDLPVYEALDNWTSTSTVTFIRSVLQEHAQGIFNTPAQMVDWMRRDDRISGCLDTRVYGLLGAPIDFEASGDARRKSSVVKEVRENFWDWCPSYALGQLLDWGRTLGIGLGENVWVRTSTKWTPHLKVWHPRFIYWRWDTRSYWVVTEGGPVEVTPGDGRWVLLAPWGSQRGWMYGLLRRLATPWLMRQWGYRDWARYSEVHGMPFRLAEVPKDADEKEKERFLREVAMLSRESTIRAPVTGQKDTEGSFSVKLVEALGKSNESFEMFLARLDKSIAISILGQNLTTEVNGGSYAAANVHDRIRREILKSDADVLEYVIREHILKPWAKFNFGDEELAPYMNFQVEATEDKGQNAQALLNLGSALTALETAGLNVDKVTVAASFGVPLMPDPLLPRVDPQLVADAHDSIMQDAASNPGVAGGTKKPAKPKGGDADKSGGGRGDGAAAQSKPGALPKLPRPEPVLNSRKDRATPAQVEAQLYVDHVAETTAAAATLELAPTAQTLLAAVDVAQDFESLKAAIIRLTGETKPKKLADLMQRALLVAELVGKAVVKQDT